MAPPRISTTARARLLVGTALTLITLAVWVTAQMHESVADRVFDQSRAGQRTLTAMLDQQTSFRGFALSRQDDFLEPFRTGGREFDEAISDLRRDADAQTLALVDAQVVMARRWQRMAQVRIDVLRVTPLGAPSEGVNRRKAVFDRFRSLNATLQTTLAERKDRDLGRASLLSVGAVLGLVLLLAAIGYVTIERDATRVRRDRARRRAYRAGQDEFTGTMQVMRDEREAYGLVKRHLERSLDGSAVTVLIRNNSDSRLVPATSVLPDAPLAGRLQDARPDSCLAVRLGRVHEAGAAVDPLLTCDLCDQTAADVTCVPCVVGGEVIGSVLVQNDRPAEPVERKRIMESVTQSAPVLANLRTLAIAEARAATDALTGLPNARSCQDTIKRMVAHAGRTLSPLSAVLLDLDHFKRINDRFGHGVGDDALAAAAAAIASSVRASDFAGRAGGEEFVILLPDTDQEGAIQVAEKVRAAIAELEVPPVEGEITASFGVATFPQDAHDADRLVRQADRALYAAKAAGRNRVEVSSTSPPPTDDATAEEASSVLLAHSMTLRADWAAALEGSEAPS